MRSSSSGACGAKGSSGVKDLKAQWMNISGNTVEAFMKDVQIDATSFPGKAFDMTFECRNKMWASLRSINAFQSTNGMRWDVRTLRKRPLIFRVAAIIDTAKMYNPNMKVEILAIPPRRARTCAASGGSASERRTTLNTSACNPPRAEKSSNRAPPPQLTTNLVTGDGMRDGHGQGIVTKAVTAGAAFTAALVTAGGGGGPG